MVSFGGWQGGSFVFVLDMERGDRIALIDRLAHEAVFFSPDNTKLLSIEPEEVREFPLTMDELITEACSRLPRNLTVSEWGQFFGESEPYRETCPGLPNTEPDVAKPLG
jgi:hypothetical protein